MAGLRCVLPFDDITLTVAGWKTVASVKAGSDQMSRIIGTKLAANGLAGDAEPIKFRWSRITAGTGTATSTLLQKTCNAFTATPRTTGRINFTAVPTYPNPAETLFPDRFHPQGGLVQAFEFDNFMLKEATEIALEMYVPTGGTAVKVDGHIEIEE